MCVFFLESRGFVLKEVVFSCVFFERGMVAFIKFDWGLGLAVVG